MCIGSILLFGCFGFALSYTEWDVNGVVLSVDAEWSGEAGEGEQVGWSREEEGACGVRGVSELSEEEPAEHVELRRRGVRRRGHTPEAHGASLGACRERELLASNGRE